jgi:hypothetical protein
MRFVQIGNPHASNEAAFRRGCTLFGIEYEKVVDASCIEGMPDLIWAPLKWINPAEFSCKIMFGPHFFVFPSQLPPASDNCVYNCLSEWNKRVHEEFLPLPTVPYTCLPFGVKLPPVSEKLRTKVLVYYKHRVPEDLEFVRALLTRRGIAHTLIWYGHYESANYGALLDECMFMVVVDAHESQGFALCEAMARNVPLLVYDASTMKQEYVNGFPYAGRGEKLLATSVPYWDSRCGEKTQDPRELDAALTCLYKKLDTYRPREFISETLSDEICFQKIVDFVVK